MYSRLAYYQTQAGTLARDALGVTVARSTLAARSRWSVRHDAPEPLRLLTCSRPCIYKLARPVWLLFFFFFLLWLCMVIKEALATRFPSTVSCTRDSIPDGPKE